jgi:hypothetical protein
MLDCMTGSALLLAIVPTAIMLGTIVWLWRWLRHRIAERRADLVAIAAGRATMRVENGANCFGRESLGRTQARGNGLLALFDDELVFLQWVPKRDIRIRLDRIITVDEVSGFLGKTVARALLRVAWRDPEGRDIAVWSVRDLGAWRAAIDGARTPKSTEVSGT